MTIPPEAERRIAADHVVWLTAVTDRDAPAPNPVWFVSDGEDLVVFSAPTSRKVRNISRRPLVTAHFNSDTGPTPSRPVSSPATSRSITTRSSGRSPPPSRRSTATTTPWSGSGQPRSASPTADISDVQPLPAGNPDAQHDAHHRWPPRDDTRAVFAAVRSSSSTGPQPMVRVFTDDEHLDECARLQVHAPRSDSGRHPASKMVTYGLSANGSWLRRSGGGTLDR